jgi:CDP-2,3-bis-(O-geranylgeranyl)-sn-glycerol synthase
MLEIKLLILLAIANGSPILAAKLFGKRGRKPIDNGYTLSDGNPLFGRSKTWRGLISSIIATTLFAVLMGLSWRAGFVFGVFTMAGDLLSSFIKRRLGKPASSQSLLLDQVPETFLPLIAGAFILDYQWPSILLCGLIFVVLAMTLSPLLYRVGLRKKPY